MSNTKTLDNEKDTRWRNKGGFHKHIKELLTERGKVCPNCGGAGYIGDGVCHLCDGEGYIYE